jgi:hypothetical protein
MRGLVAAQPGHGAGNRPADLVLTWTGTGWPGDLGPVRCLAMYQAGWAGLRICMSLMHNKRTRVSGAARGRNRGNGAAAGAREVTA